MIIFNNYTSRLLITKRKTKRKKHLYGNKKLERSIDPIVMYEFSTCTFESRSAAPSAKKIGTKCSVRGCANRHEGCDKYVSSASILSLPVSESERCTKLEKSCAQGTTGESSSSHVRAPRLCVVLPLPMSRILSSRRGLSAWPRAINCLHACEQLLQRKAYPFHTEIIPLMHQGRE